MEKKKSQTSKSLNTFNGYTSYKVVSLHHHIMHVTIPKHRDMPGFHVSLLLGEGEVYVWVERQL